MKKKTGLKFFVILGLIAIGGMVAYLASTAPEKSEPAEIAEETAVINPLTGITSDEGFDPDALNRRIAAFVVENSPDSRPQWGMDDPEYSPDIILEGEVEAGITRTLWMYADYNKLPEIIGPMRSARPPYIKFSELFDSIFIHWGQSGSKGNYIGASTVFRRDKVDHINQMTFNDTVGLYGRDQTRSTAVEHRGILYGDKVAAAIEAKGFRTEPKEYSKLNFSRLAWLTRVPNAESVHVDYSAKTSWESTVWTYDPEDEQYHSANFNNNVARDNLLILFDETEYIDKADYKGAGYTLTYCNYDLAGGQGKLISKGTSRDISWNVTDEGRLVLTDVEASKAAEERAAAESDSESGSAEASEAKPVRVDASLYPGKTWIGWVSSNNGGRVRIDSETMGTSELTGEDY